MISTYRYGFKRNNGAYKGTFFDQLWPGRRFRHISSFVTHVDSRSLQSPENDSTTLSSR